MSEKAPADPRLAELQSWLDSSQAENESLRRQLAESEAKQAALEVERAGLLRKVKGLPPDDSQVSRETFEHEHEVAETLRRELAELQCVVAAEEAELQELKAHAPPSESAEHAKVVELQSWLDAAEAENEALRKQLERAGGAPSDELDALRRQVAELQCVVAAQEPTGATLSRPTPPAGNAQLAELQSWLDAAETENARLRAELAKAKPEVVGSGDPENEYLREKLAESEAALHAMRGLNERLSEQIQTTAKRDVERLEAELAAARAASDPRRVAELEDALETATEAISTLQAERSAALEQVRRYIGADAESVQATVKEHDAEAQKLLAQKDARVAELEAELLGQAEDLHGFRTRIAAWERRDAELQQQIDELRVRACDAEAKVGQVVGVLEATETREAKKDARLAELESRLEEQSAWLAQAEKEQQSLQAALEAAHLKHALAAPSTPVTTAQQTPPPPPREATEDDGVDSAALRELKLERALEAERQVSAALRRFANVSEHALAKAKDELELAHARLKDLKARAGSSDTEAGEALDRLFATQREVAALQDELRRALGEAVVESADDAIVDEAEVQAVVSGPLGAVDQLSAAQAALAREAADALQVEQRARDALLGDLQWLKAEVEKLSSVREDLRHRIAAMVKRELDRKAMVAKLLSKLRENEVSAASRLGAVRRLQAAVEQSQRMAVKVQTVYFQKQIGSLQRQLEKEKRARASPARKPAA